MANRLSCLLLQLIIFLCGTLYSFFGVGQNDESSLQRLIDQSLAHQNPKEAIDPLRKGLTIVPLVRDSLKAAFYLNMGIVYSKLYVNDSAIFYFKESLKISGKNKIWKLLTGNAHNYLGNVARQQSDNEGAMIKYVEGLNALEGASTREEYILEGKLIGNIGGIYYDLGEFNKALEFAERSRDHTLKYELTERYGFEYLLVGFAARAAGQLEKALENNEKALDAMLEAGDSSYLSHIYYNIASLHQLKMQWNDALKNYDKAIQFADLFNEEEVLVSCLIAQGQIYIVQSNPDKAIAVSLTAKKKSIENTFLPKVIEALDVQYQALKSKDEFRKALEVHDEYAVYRDSLYQIQTRQSIEDAETKYETKKKEQTIIQLQQESLIKDLQVREEKQWRNSMIMLAGSFGVIALLFYGRFRIKKRSSELLDKKNAELKELNGFKDRLFTIISHDLRSPLSAFSNLTSSLADNVNQLAPEEIEVYLRNLNASSIDLTRLLNNLLEWALTQTGSISYNPENIYCDSLAEEVVTHLRPSLTEKKIELHNFIPGKLDAFADKNMVVIVVRNLLSNAIKFSKIGDTITIFAGRKDGLMTLGVKDQGIGISTFDQAKLFKASGEVHTVGNSSEKGTGIGLILCKELVERNGGNIYIESKLGDGSNFYFTLPEAKQSQ